MNPLTAWHSQGSTTFGRRPAVADTVRWVLRPAVHALTAAVAGAVSALIVLQVDAAADLHLPISAANGRAAVSGLVTALVTIALFAVWMRSVVVGLASGQISPRIIAEYLDDDVQWELITGMSAAFAFTLTVLLQLPPGDGPGVPAVSLLLAVGMVVLGLVMVMGALRSAVRGITPSRVLSSLAARAHTAISHDPSPDDGRHEGLAHGDPATEATTIIESDHPGWVRKVDHAAILEIMPARARLGLHVDVGSFVTNGDRIASCDAAISDEDIDTVRDAIELTGQRRPDGDLGFVLQQLRDLVQQALGSEGDSSLAEEGLLHLRAILSQLIETGLPSGHAIGRDDRAIVALERRTVCDHLMDTLEPLVYAGQRSGPIARRWVTTTIRQLRRRATADGDALAALDELLELMEDDHEPVA